MKIDVEHHPERGEFVVTIDGLRSQLRYERVGDEVLDLRSTFVHRDLRGRTVGIQLVRSALDYARAQGYRVIPTCWFVETVVERYPDYRDLLVTR